MNNNLPIIGLYASGAKAAHLEAAIESQAQYLILCLEDGTPEDQKLPARYLVKQALIHYQHNNKCLCVRINGRETPYWQKDIQLLFADDAYPQRIRLPMVRHLDDVTDTIFEIEKYHRPLAEKYLEVMVESVEGYLALEAILQQCQHQIAVVTVGGEDLLQSAGSPTEVKKIKQQIITICQRHKVPCLETTYMDYLNVTGLRNDTEQALRMGFSGRSVIHPHHIEICQQIRLVENHV